MPPFSTADELYRVFDALFSRMQSDHPDAAQALQKSKVVIQLACVRPDATITLNGRKNPPATTFGTSKMRADVKIGMDAETLHQIFLGELPLKKAISKKQLKVSGPIWKAVALADIFDQGKTMYPEILRENGFSG